MNRVLCHPIGEKLLAVARFKAECSYDDRFGHCFCLETHDQRCEDLLDVCDATVAIYEDYFDIRVAVHQAQ